MSRPEQSHRHAVTGRDSQGDRCTLMVYRLADIARGLVVRVVVISVDSTERGAVALSPAQAIKAAAALRAAAGATSDSNVE